MRATGAEFVPLPPAADYDDRLDLVAQNPDSATMKGLKLAISQTDRYIVRPGREQYRTVMACHAQEPVDVLLAETAFLGAAFLLGHTRGTRPPIVACGVIPLLLASRDTAPIGLGLPPLRGPVGRWRNRALSAVMDRTLFAPVNASADGINRGLHGRPLGFPVLDWPRHAEALAQFTVAAFEYPRSDAPENLHFIGPVLSPSRAPLPPWWDELDGSRPVVHVTQGTFANKDLRQVIVPALQGLAGDDVLVVVSTGGRSLDTLPPLPANARAAEMLPYDELLPRTDVYVTNGGYGGVHYALCHGVPVVTTGGLEDKPEVGARVAWAGVGRRLRSETPSPERLAHAVRAVLEDPSYRRAAEGMAEAMARSGGLGELGRIVDALVPDGGR
ncbi:glycosyltransferase [Citricoccus sp. SGAir0253]|uniref:glycosyltransferase n=1 Tax=Citricoccus sp. SGAir0253 TaxID=2567881 RepID=UPI0010CCEBC0|nr:glycosyltransferase [Citricoccus sp. SGAir0253]QCU78639.1 glycosyltransferase [Citricoccus sp. SGAir0253]